MNPTPVSVVAEACGARITGGAEGVLVCGVTQDTRRLRGGDLYVALRGPRHNGNDFVRMAADLGASAALVTPDAITHGSPAPEGFPLLVVPDTLAALQQLAAWWRGELGLTAVCVTGSSGKTSTREFLARVLEELGPVTATNGNYNNHIGVPLTILSAKREDKFGVWEVAMNHPGEIAPLAALARPDISVITNIGTAHIEFFPNRAGIAEEKGSLFTGTKADGLCFYPGADDFAKRLAELAGPERARPVWLDKGVPRAEHPRREGMGMGFDLVTDEGRFEVKLPAPGLHMVCNALLAAAVGLECGASGAAIAKALSRAELEPGRMGVLHIGGRFVLDDSYNANPESMIAALETLREWELPDGAMRMAVLGAMAELGHYSNEGCERVGKAAAGCADILIAVGNQAEAIARAAQGQGLERCFCFGGVQDTAEAVISESKPGDVVLVKGSRSARMERLVGLLRQRWEAGEKGG